MKTLIVTINPVYSPCERPGQVLKIHVAIENNLPPDLEEIALEKEIINRLRYTVENELETTLLPN